MAEAIDFETRDWAGELYIVDGLTLEQVAKDAGASIQTIKQWSVKYEWGAKRDEYREAIGGIKRNTAILRKKLIAKALSSLDPQDVYAVSRLEAMAKGQKTEDRGQGSEVRKIETPEDAVAALQEAIEIRINGMLTRPDAISLKGIKEMKEALKLVEQMKAKQAKGDQGDKVLDAAAIKEIREQLL